MKIRLLRHLINNCINLLSTIYLLYHMGLYSGASLICFFMKFDY